MSLAGMVEDRSISERSEWAERSSMQSPRPWSESFSRLLKNSISSFQSRRFSATLMNFSRHLPGNTSSLDLLCVLASCRPNRRGLGIGGVYAWMKASLGIRTGFAGK